MSETDIEKGHDQYNAAVELTRRLAGTRTECDAAIVENIHRIEDFLADPNIAALVVSRDIDTERLDCLLNEAKADLPQRIITYRAFAEINEQVSQVTEQRSMALWRQYVGLVGTFLEGHGVPR